MLTDAIFHLTVKLGQRSKGRSAVAKAAYDAACRLYDARQYRTFDYSRKRGVVASFILTPENAPAWCSDREQLWNRTEAAERRKDAVIWREIEVSIPRGIPPAKWQEFVATACQAYVANGVICDVSLHCPRASDGGDQPHAHILLTPRALDASTGTGFASVKNSALTAMFESGGRHGGKKGDALQSERARWASIINFFYESKGQPCAPIIDRMRHEGLSVRRSRKLVKEDFTPTAAECNGMVITRIAECRLQHPFASCG